MRPITVLALTGVLATVAAAPSVIQDPEEPAIRAALEHYLQGHATGDGAHMRIAFHPAAELFWIAADTLARRTSEAYAGGFTGRPADDEAQRRRRIVSIDRSGNAAIGKIELDYPSGRIVDYMSLLKIGGEWKMVNKIFYREPKPGP
jgi:hypothetical protein